LLITSDPKQGIQFTFVLGRTIMWETE